MMLYAVVTHKGFKIFKDIIAGLSSKVYIINFKFHRARLQDQLILPFCLAVMLGLMSTCVVQDHVAP